MDCLLLLQALLLSHAAAQNTAAIEFNRDIRPILSDRCFACHGPDANNRKAGLRLDQEEAAKTELKAGKGNVPIVPGAPERSTVYQRITSKSPAARMPPAYAGHAALAQAQIDLLRRWIEEGAPWQKHWAFLPPRRPAIASGSGANPIDALVRRTLARHGRQLSPPASKETLLRRVTLDLTGLPPTPEERAAFLADTSPQAYEKVVERLLASPRYAERMAIRWLEAARYADTNGYQSDGERSMWRWRDWVLDAFRSNMPFDRFTIEQIAGDLLPNATRQQKIATGFHRNHRTNAEGGIVEEEFRVEYVADRVETTATVWLGLTLGCSRCHDHKYDPFSQKEFYQLFAFFNQTPDRGLVYNFGNEEPYIQAPAPEHERRLAAHERRVAQAEAEWKRLQPAIEAAQRRWESKLPAEPLYFATGRGQVLHLPLKDETFDGGRVVEAGQNVAKFDFRDPFTLSAWIRPVHPTGAIVSRSEDYWEGEGYQFFLHEGKLRLHITRRFTDISLRLESETRLPLHQWQHVAVTYDGYRKGKGVRIYVNGESVPIRILFDELTYPFGPKEPFRVGGGVGEERRFRGQIADVRAYNRALASDEVRSLSLRDPIQQIAAIPSQKRTVAQKAHLRLCFLERYASPAVQAARAKLEAVRDERRKYFDSIPTVMVMEELPERRPTFVLRRGAYDAPGEPVEPGVPAVLPPLPAGSPNNRLGLAYWLVDRDNPLTARVTVNRFWQMLWGTGLVKTAEDFGSQGEWPLHSELLDWLAVEFMESGWNVKHILRTIVLSDTYRQSSQVTADLLQADPENRLLARGPRLRLPAEMIRDQALAASGLLVERYGGPSVKPYQPPGLWQELSGGRGYVPDKGAGLWRRSLYTYWKRTVAPPSMINFDSPTRESCIVRETRTNTPLQALTLMNDVTYLEAARKLAEAMARERSLATGFRRVLGREPRPEETAVLTQTLDAFRQRYADDPQAASHLLAHGEAPRDPLLDPVELAAYTSIASLILNLDEAVTKE